MAQYQNFISQNEWQKPSLGIPSDGLTVAELIKKLQKMNPKSKVVLYNPNGDTYAIQAVQDNDYKVAIF